MRGWVTARLGEVCELVSRGISPKYLNEGGTLVINQKCIRDHTVNYGLGRRHDPAAKRIAADRFIRRGDALVNSTGTGTLGRVAQVRHDPPEPATVDSHVTIVRPVPGKFHPDFFGYIMIVLEDRLTASGTGLGGQTELGRKTIEAFAVCFPQDVEEQRRIVAVLDESFAAIATATANAQKNVTNARMAFDAWLREVMFVTEGGGWARCRLGDVTTKIGSGATPRGGKESYLLEGTPLIRSLNVHDRRFKPEQLAYIDDSQSMSLDHVTLHRGDVLLNITGASVARCCILPDHLAGGRVNQHVSIIRAQPSTLLPKFLELLLTSPAYKERLLGVGDQGGSTRQAITKAEIQNFEIVMPSVEAQQSIIHRALQIERELLTLSDLYSKKAISLNLLKQSVLHHAFTGDLTEREPLAA